MQDSDESDEDALHIHIEENGGERNGGDEEIIAEQETSENVDKKRGRPQGLADDSEDSANEQVVGNGNQPREREDVSEDSGNEQVVRNGDQPQEREDSESSHQEGNDGRKRGRPEDDDSESSDDDLDIPLIRTKRARQAVLDDDDDE